MAFATIRAMIGATVVTVTLPIVGTVTFGVAGPALGGIIGVVVGFCKGWRYASRYNREAQESEQRQFRDSQERLNEEQEHFGLAIANPRERGMWFGGAKTDNLNNVTTSDWNKLLSIRLANVPYDQDRLRI